MSVNPMKNNCFYSSLEASEEVISARRLEKYYFEA